VCEACDEYVCKNCTQILDDTAFSFLEKRPDAVSHSHYCSSCFDSKVVPELEIYNEIMERAKNVFVFFTTQRKTIPTIRRSKHAVHVKKCHDREETILRLAFFAAQENFNALTDVELTSQKIRNEAYQTSSWQGSGVPAEVDADKVERWMS
jgi:hypothetical protein